MGLNDVAWEKLFKKYDILSALRQKGEYIISAKQIKEYREPRLMTKFDHTVSLPQLFQENNLSILPISRGDYIISSFSAYKKLESPSIEKVKVSIPSHLQSLMPQYITSEAIALNCAQACGILNDFLEDEALISTVSGRMSSGMFGFDINVNNGLKTVNVTNSQIEIDAAYEGINYLSLIEAKKALPDDFLIRQLYYPFRTWTDRISKPVKSIFLVFSNGTFNLYEYRFENIRNYNSLYLVKQKNYVIATEISLSDIINLLQSTPVLREPEISFPQANSMERIINLMELLYEKPMTKQEITINYGFDERQTNYYTDAGRYLNLIEKEMDVNRNIFFYLTSVGRHIMQLDYKERQLEVVSLILSHKVFRETLELHLRYGEMPTNQEIVKIMKCSSLYQVEADSTYERRASTVSGWVNWILRLIEE